MSVFYLQMYGSVTVVFSCFGLVPCFHPLSNSILLPSESIKNTKINPRDLQIQMYKT